MAIFNNGFDLSQATTTINGIPCGEYVRDYYEAADRQAGPDLSKTYICQWNSRFLVANACLGLVSSSGGKNGAPNFQLPLQHPQIPSCYCSSIRITGKGMPFEGPYQLAYQAAMITVGFKSYAYNFQASDDPGGLFNIDPDTSFIYATQDIDVGEESLEFRPGSCSYATAAGPGGAINLTIPINAPQSIPFAHAIMRLTFNKLPYLPTNSIGLYNNLNNGTFLGCQAGTVKFKGTSTHREFQTDGTMTQTMTNTYMYRPAADWNYVPNPNPGGGQWVLRVGRAGGGWYIYPYSDLTQTFPSGYSS